MRLHSLTPRSVSLIAFVAATLALGSILLASRRASEATADSTVHELAGTILSLTRVGEAHPARRTALLTGHVVNVQYGKDSPAADIESFTLVDEDGDSHTVVVPNPNHGITKKLEQAMDQHCAIRVQVISAEGTYYLYGDAASIQLICPQGPAPESTER